jgi:CheY-like chemotaxis protein
MPKTLLLADDSITIQKVVGITFAGEDFAITAVDNGDDAIAKARELKPDVILADVVMPRKNGYEVCEAVKGDPALRHIPVLLLAGTFEAFDEARARAARADGHIAKPFESGALINNMTSRVFGYDKCVTRTANCFYVKAEIYEDAR